MKISNLLNSELTSVSANNKSNISNDFKNFLFDSINKLNSYEKEAENLGLMLSTGEVDNLHDVMISSQKAEIALQFGIEVRNKVMDAYKEIMRMQV